ncbi:GGDEF domain-containing protein [Pelagibacterium luteolum]|uniref:GGDEF domain-containing protein, diguanylate cyclase (C-di-GMP synthetase) or its enzymatically inactive variants n=1 Tax=Pelagibacterium luteolum TaxID=440168 RepID=A0A1G7SDJ3_9HYPH|nr:GGDEF domain-containing protein [Pelagibacterium luteolum]SDG21098.1 GGDEF domain-containing protein, diguanylate cyclase (c-di-GMP synthetase) or its enzymatically inactive variants [Pelagibacterium luteolum]
MSGGIFIFSVAICLCLVKASAFFTLSLFDRTNRPARLFGYAFLSAGVSFTGELVLATGVAPALTRMVIAMAMVVMFVLIAYGLALRYRAPLPRGGGFAITLASALLFILILDLPRGDFIRQMLYQIPYALLSLLSLSVIARAGNKSVIDWIFVGMFFILAVQFLAKPFIALATGGVGTTPEQFASTLYAEISVAMGAVVLIILATSALGMMIYDSAATLIRRSERDSETGFLNRGGFTAHAQRLLGTPATHDANPEPGATDCALTLIALDHPLRPGYPPASTAVADLARTIAEIAPRDALVGRMAEHDFAILAQGENLFAARRTAETIRKQFGQTTTTPPIGLSVGITEREPGDVYAELLARSLWALDEAQRNGGNCVRLSARSGFGLSSSGSI